MTDGGTSSPSCVVSRLLESFLHAFGNKRVEGNVGLSHFLGEPIFQPLFQGQYQSLPDKLGGGERKIVTTCCYEKKNCHHMLPIKILVPFTISCDGCQSDHHMPLPNALDESAMPV